MPKVGRAEKVSVIINLNGNLTATTRQSPWNYLGLVNLEAELGDQEVEAEHKRCFLHVFCRKIGL